MPVCQVSQFNKKPLLEPVRYQNKEIKYGTGVLRNRIEIKDAGLPMNSYVCVLSPCKYALHVPVFGGFIKVLLHPSALNFFGLFSC
jgi:hypothetical protein